MSLQHRHDQAHRLDGGEHQRRQPQPAAHPVTPVRAADRLDRQLRLPQDRDVTPRGPVRHTEPLAQLLRGDPRIPLDNLQRHQRPRRRAHLMRHVSPIPEANRPQPALDANRDGGMTVTVGRLRRCPVLDYKFVALGHNTIRGAAGAAILNAELMHREGLLS